MASQLGWKGMPQKNNNSNNKQEESLRNAIKWNESETFHLLLSQSLLRQLVRQNFWKPPHNWKRDRRGKYSKKFSFQDRFLKVTIIKKEITSINFLFFITSIDRPGLQQVQFDENHCRKDLNQVIGHSFDGRATQ